MFRPFVRILGDFCEGDMRGGHMPLNSEVLKHRFQNFLQKKVEVCISVQNEKYFDRFLDHFFGRFFEHFFSKLFNYFGTSRHPLAGCCLLVVN